jgi:Tfp pilus assembly protein FimT
MGKVRGLCSRTPALLIEITREEPRTMPRKVMPSVSCRRFSLVELLTVLVLMMIVISITLPSFNKMMTGSAVDSASRMLGAQLRLARQYAITQRRRVAVLMPSKDIQNHDGYSYDNTINPWSVAERNSLNPFLHVSFRSCFVDGSGNFEEWVPNSQWEYLPVGSAIFEADTDQTTTNFTPTNINDSGGTYVKDVLFPVGTIIGDFNGNNILEDGVSVSDKDDLLKNVRAVIFKPTGALDSSSSEIVVTVGEGLYVNGNWIIRNGKNWQDLMLNPYTGRLEYKGPESP